MPSLRRITLSRRDVAESSTTAEEDYSSATPPESDSGSSNLPHSDLVEGSSQLLKEAKQSFTPADTSASSSAQSSPSDCPSVTETAEHGPSAGEEEGKLPKKRRGCPRGRRWVKGLLPPEEFVLLERPRRARCPPQSEAYAAISSAEMVDQGLSAAPGAKEVSQSFQAPPLRLLNLSRIERLVKEPENREAVSASQPPPAAVDGVTDVARAHAASATVRSPLLSAAVITAIFGWRLVRASHDENGFYCHLHLQHSAAPELRATLSIPPDGSDEILVNRAVPMTSAECAAWLARQTTTGYTTRPAAWHPPPPAMDGNPSAIAPQVKSELLSGTGALALSEPTALDRPPKKRGRPRKDTMSTTVQLCPEGPGQRGRKNSCSSDVADGVAVSSAMRGTGSATPFVGESPEAPPPTVLKFETAHADELPLAVEPNRVPEQAAAVKEEKADSVVDSTPVEAIVRDSPAPVKTPSGHTSAHSNVVPIPAAAQRLPPVGHGLPALRGPLRMMDGTTVDGSPRYLARARALGKVLAHHEAALSASVTSPTPLSLVTAQHTVAGSTVVSKTQWGLREALATGRLRGDALHAAVRALQTAEQEEVWYTRPMLTSTDPRRPVPFPREPPHTFLPASAPVLLAIQRAMDAKQRATGPPWATLLTDGIPEETRIAIPAAYRLRGSFLAGPSPAHHDLPGLVHNSEEDYRYCIHRRILPKDVRKELMTEQTLQAEPEDRVAQEPQQLPRPDGTAATNGAAAEAPLDLERVLRRGAKIPRVPMADVEWRYGP